MSDARGVRDADGYTSPTSGSVWLPVIGLEVHCQLQTNTKLFCSCPNRFGAQPNTLVCPVCSGQPGALPMLNRAALELAVRAALALDAEVAPVSYFARKNYFYCDLPKGYQISQYDRPYCSGGGLQLSNGRFVRLERIHMEEDAGKAIHDRGPGTLVDLNRAGIPLIESVTQADITSADEADEYLRSLKEVLLFAGVSDCDMEKGSLRCDVNVSVHREGEPWGAKVEIKNLNSFRHVRASIEHEIERQVQLYEGGDAEAFPRQETRLFDADAGVTRTMRSKEDAQDYRYFPDPDLPPVVVQAALIEAQRAALPELPAERRRRYLEELGLNEKQALVLTGDPEVADLFEATAAAAPPRAAANWIQNEVLRSLGDERCPACSVSELNFGARELAQLIGLVQGGTLSNSGARKVFERMLEQGGQPAALVEQLGLQQVSDPAAIEGWCREALEQQPQIIEAVRAGNEKALGACIGPVMQKSGGRADPSLVRAALLRLIEEG